MNDPRGAGSAGSTPHRIGILGASGYAGGELLRLCSGHPGLELSLIGADRHAGEPIAELHPQLAPVWGDRPFDGSDVAGLDGLDLVFLATPLEVSAEIVPQLAGRVGHVVDLSPAFRLVDAEAYPTWYRFEHPAPELLAQAVYGLPELTRERLGGASLVAAPGCYATAAILALAPLVRSGSIEPDGIVVDAASGVSGAGRELRETSMFCNVDEDFTAYGLLRHRHTPEMEQEIGAQLLFTPHLAPMSRGILATCYARPAAGGSAPSSEDVLELLAKAYANEPFLVVREASPSTKATAGSNAVHLSARVDPRTGWVIVLCALDNLVKGAAGQALQCANAVLDLPETTGLGRVGVWP